MKKAEFIERVQYSVVPDGARLLRRDIAPGITMILPSEHNKYFFLAELIGARLRRALTLMTDEDDVTRETLTSAQEVIDAFFDSLPDFGALGSEAANVLRQNIRERRRTLSFALVRIARETGVPD
jgi:hypothetical protein